MATFLAPAHSHIQPAKIEEVLKLLGQERREGRVIPRHERIVQLQQLASAGGVQTMEHLLPLCLRLNGEPYALDDHYPFSPLYNLAMPSKTMYKTGRQVAKTTNGAAHTVMLSACIPGFKTLCVTPLYEQIRRFSSNYVRPFIDSSPIRTLWSGTSTDNSVLQKSFKNGSMILFSFALLDTTRIRGASCHRVYVDECFKQGTLVPTPAGAVAIEQLQVGDPVLSFDPTGAIVEDCVAEVMDHGERECYTLTFSDGTEISATSDTWLATDSGWKRVGDVITASVHGTTAADDLGNDAGGRVYLPGERNSESAILYDTRREPTRLQLSQTPDLVCVRSDATQTAEERRLRRMVEQMDHAQSPVACPFSFFVLPGWREDNFQGVARQADLGGSRLVVSGRRIFDEEAMELALSHRGVSAEASTTSSRVATGSRRDVRRTASATATGRWHLGRVLADRRHGQGYEIPPRTDFAVLARVDAVQGDHPRSHGYCDVSLVPGNLYNQDAVFAQEPSEVLSERGLPASPWAGPYYAGACETRGGRKTPGPQQGAIPAKYRSEAGLQSRACSEENARGNRAAQLSPPRITVPEEGRAGSSPPGGVAVPALRAACDGFAGGRAPAVSPRLQGQGPVAARQVAAVRLVGIRYAGRHRVWDVATKKNHTFFPGGVAAHNCQSMDKDHLPIIYEAMSHSPWGNIVFLTGTPLTLDNTLEVEWQNSSRAEWFIKCRHPGCGVWNIPSLEYHLDKMIGPVTDWVSEKYPGVVCHMCRKPLYPRPIGAGGDGRWVHRHQKKRLQYVGYHIPQIIMPIHFAKKQKWAELVAKQSGWGNTSRAQFCNEVLGESVDVGQKVITETELKRACTLPWRNDTRNPNPQIRQRLPHYHMRILGVDWGGGGKEGVSFTALALIGVRSDGRFEVLWGKKLVLSQEHLREAMEIAYWMQLFNCDLLAHDYTGAGATRETILVQAGFELNRVMPFHLLRTARQSLIRYVAPTPIHNRAHYVLDKARSLLYTTTAIKLGLINFFQWDDEGDQNRGLIYDFLALTELKEESRLAGDIYSIQAPTLSDDFAQAVNFAVCAGWHVTQRWPNFAEAASRMNISPRQRRLAGDDEFGWSDRDTR